MRDEKLYLVDIIEAADALAGYVTGLEFDAFKQDNLRFSAALHQLTVIGEAVARLPQPFKQNHPQVEWRKIVEFRNFLVRHQPRHHLADYHPRCPHPTPAGGRNSFTRVWARAITLILIKQKKGG